MNSMNPTRDRRRRVAALRREARTPVPVVTRADRDLADLREIIHILAMALTEGKSLA